MSEPLVDVTGARRRRARAQRLRWVKRGAVALGVLLVVGALVWVVWGSPWLLARHVDVRGTAILSAEEVTEAAQVPPLSANSDSGIPRKPLTMAP